MKILRFGLLLLAGAALLPAQTTDAKALALVADALKALGGERFLAMTDRVEEGRAFAFRQGSLRGLTRATFYTRYIKRPPNAPPDWSGVEERQSFGKDEDYAYLFTTGNAYEITFRGARPMPPDVVERYHAAMLHDLLNVLHHRVDEPGMVLRYRGADVFDNQPVEKVEFIDAENRSVTGYFQSSTKLPVRAVYERRDARTRRRVVEEILYGKFRDTGNGVVWPFTIQRKRDGERFSEIFSTTVQVNKGLSSTLFVLPSEMKVFPPER